MSIAYKIEEHLCNHIVGWVYAIMEAIRAPLFSRVHPTEAVGASASIMIHPSAEKRFLKCSSFFKKLA
jgi:hypothetical protein